MRKATLVLIMLAALGLGTLVGVSLVKDNDATEMAAPVESASAQSTGGAPVFRFLKPDGITVAHDEFGQPLPIMNGENFIRRDGAFKSDSITIQLDVDATVEYKALMKQGDTLEFHWRTDSGEAYYDFHAHDDAFGPEFFTRYDEGEGAERSGSIMAGYDGQHGWFWLNLEDSPITITLDVAGFYEDIVEIDVGGY
jgi:hypothetical protein